MMRSRQSRVRRNEYELGDITQRVSVLSRQIRLVVVLFFIFLSHTTGIRTVDLQVRPQSFLPYLASVSEPYHRFEDIQNHTTKDLGSIEGQGQGSGSGDIICFGTSVLFPSCWWWWVGTGGELVG
jgi:hypothetical protein